MTDRVKDRILLFLALIALCVEALTLLGQMRLLRVPWVFSLAESDEPIIGRIEKKRRTLTGRSSSSLSWFPLQTGDAVRLRDTLMTGVESSSRLSLADLGELELGPETLIYFAPDPRSREGALLNLELEEGGVRVVSHQKPLRLRWSGEEFEIDKDSEVSIEKNPSEPLARLRVERGRASVGEGRSVTELSNGVPIEVNPTSKGPEPRATVPFPIHLFSPGLGARLVAIGEKARCEFRWDKSVREIDSYQLEIAHSDAFSAPQIFNTRQTKLSVDLEPGKYFWRVRHTTGYSQISSFVVFSDPKYQALAPLESSFIRERTSFQLSWAPVAGAASYIVEIAATPDFQRPLTEKNTKEPRMLLGNFAPGVYYWRIRATHPDGGEWPASRAFYFTVKRAIAAPRIKGARVIERHGSRPTRWRNFLYAWMDWLIPSALADEKPKVNSSLISVQFEWNAVEGAKGYVLEVSHTASFRKVAKRKKSSHTRVTLPMPWSKFVYWRVAALDIDGTLGPFSSPQRISLPSPLPVLVSVPPAAPTAPPIPRVERMPTTSSSEIKPPESEPDREWYKPSRIEAGYIIGIRRDSVTGPDFLLNASGAIPSAYVAVFSQMRNAQLGVEGQGGFLNYQSSTSSGISSGNKNSWTALRFLWRRRVFFDWLGFTVGLAYQNQPTFDRGGREQLAIHLVSSEYVLVGPRLFFSLSQHLSATLEALIEVAPLGSVRAFGVFSRASVAYGRLWGWITPVFQLGFHPIHYTVEGQSLSRVEFSPSFLLSFDLDSEDRRPRME